MRYLVFAGALYYPSGRADDLKAGFPDIDSAIDYANSLSDDRFYDWAHIYDIEEMQMVWIYDIEEMQMVWERMFLHQPNQKIYAIGFHGVTDPNQNPHMSEGILATEDGYCAKSNPDGTFETFEEQYPSSHYLWARATRLIDPFPAVHDFIFLVLGPEDESILKNHKSIIAKVFDEDNRSHIRKFDNCMVIYAHKNFIEFAWEILHDEIKKTAYKRMYELKDGDQKLAEHAAWRFQRVAKDDEREEVVLLLESAGSKFANVLRNGRGYLKDENE